MKGLLVKSCLRTACPKTCRARFTNVAIVGAPLLEQMHVLPSDGGHLYGGYRAIRWLAWRLPMTWLVAPMLYLPGMTFIGQKIYLWVARNRFSRLLEASG